MELSNVLITVAKMAALLAWIFGLLWGLARKPFWQKALTVALAFGTIQLALIKFGDFALLSVFDRGLLFQAVTLAMVALGLNLIFGFNGQFSLAQWGFYGLGAYCSADITYRWTSNDASGLIVVGLGVILAGAAIIGVGALLRRKRGVPVLSAFTIYLLAVIVTCFVAAQLGGYLASLLAPGFGSPEMPGPLASPIALQAVFFLSIIFAGIFAAEVSFLFGLPVLSLGSDYFGIATLGFAIVVQTLMINSDTILPFPEMKGGRGMIGIPKLTSWFWAFTFLLVVIVIIRNFIRSSTGRASLAVREDEIAAKAMGIDIAGNKLLVFVVGSLVAGIGGAIYAHYIGFLSPGTFDFVVGFNPLIVIVFGGLGSMTGTLVSAFAWIFFLEGFLRDLLRPFGTDAPSWRFVIYPITLLLLMLLRPKGLLGTVEWGFLKAAHVANRVKEAVGKGRGASAPQAGGSAGAEVER
jgi:branched-chain amino acid transport system permease protein